MISKMCAPTGTHFACKPLSRWKDTIPSLFQILLLKRLKMFNNVFINNVKININNYEICNKG